MIRLDGSRLPWRPWASSAPAASGSTRGPGRRGEHLVREPAAQDARLGPLGQALPGWRRGERLQGDADRAEQDRHPGDDQPDRAGDHRRRRRDHHLPARPGRLQGRHRRGQGQGHRRRLDRLRRPERDLLGRHRQRAVRPRLRRPDRRADRRQRPRSASSAPTRRRPTSSPRSRASARRSRRSTRTSRNSSGKATTATPASRRRSSAPWSAPIPTMNYLWIIEGAAPGAVPAALGEGRQEARRHQGARRRRPGLDPEGDRGRLDHRDPEPVLVRHLGQHRQADHQDQERTGRSRRASTPSTSTR